MLRNASFRIPELGSGRERSELSSEEGDETMNEDELKNGAEIIVDCLKAEGVKFVFGVIGSSILDFLDVIYRTPEIRYIRTQHEQAAAFMADGYARITGKLGVCTATCGPGQPIW